MKQKLLDFLLPILLGISAMSSLVYCYSAANVVPVTAGVLVYEALLFGLLHLLYNLKFKKLRGIIYAVALFGVMSYTFSTVYSITLRKGVTFSAWFYGMSQEVIMDYLLIFAFGGGFVYISMLYYFTQVRYRSIMTLMLALIPFAIYAKRLDAMKTEYIAAIILCYIAVMVHNRQTSADSGVTVIADKAYVISICVFAIAVTALTVVIPKPKVQSLQERDADYLNGLGFLKIQATDTFLGDSDVSERIHGEPATGIILFKAYANDTTAYLRRQSYAYFEDNKWYYGVDKYPHVEYIWEEPAYMANGMSLENKLRILSLYYSEHEGYEKELAIVNKTLSDIHSTDNMQRRMFVSMEENVSFSMFSVPSGTYSLDNYTNFTVNGEFTNRNEKEDDYILFYFSDELLRNTAESLSLEPGEWSHILDWYYLKAQEYDNPASEYSMNLYAPLQEEEKYAKLHHNGEYDEYDESIRELALEITQGLTTDYEKASALAEYFTKAGFTYDLYYIPDDESIEYFIFESKTGICTDFATAMTLMARSVGLTARYCEGYLAFEKDESGAFVIRDSYAHAYTEVYIGGVGWVAFEPTVPGFEQMLYAEESVNGVVGAVIKSTGAIVGICVAIVAGLLIVIFIKPIGEGIYRIYVRSVSKKNPSNAAAKLYRRLVKRLSKRLRKDLTAYTANELSMLTDSFGVKSDTLCKAFEAYFYGGVETTKEQFIKAYEQYCSAYKIKQTAE